MQHQTTISSFHTHNASVNLSDLRKMYPDLLPDELSRWAESYPFFTQEYACFDQKLNVKRTEVSDTDQTLPNAIAVVIALIEAIQQNKNPGLLEGFYIKTCSSISWKAMVVIRFTHDRKIEIESWAKRNKHKLLAEWHFT